MLGLDGEEAVPAEQGGEGTQSERFLQPHVAFQVYVPMVSPSRTQTSVQSIPFVARPSGTSGRAARSAKRSSGEAAQAASSSRR